MKNIFTEHPSTVGESYLMHCKFALLFGMKMFMAGSACVIHAIFPFLFPKTGSRLLFEMMTDFVSRMPNVDESFIHLSNTIEKKMLNVKKKNKEAE